jgi:predicted hydrolase (HD superfamily)
MSTSNPSRDEAWALLCRYTETESLRRHALAVEGVMRHFAVRHDGDPEIWGVVGLVHDLDYEKWPEEHCVHTKRILEEENWPPELMRAVLSHAWGVCTDLEPETPMERVLYAVDELTGLVAATALVRPSRNVGEVTVKSVKKKWKIARFAAGVDRSIIERGAERLDLPLAELIAETIIGMQGVADSIGLAGQADDRTPKGEA